MATNNPDTAGMLEFPCDVERLPNGHTLITDAGDVDGRGSEVIEVDARGNILWLYNDGLRFAHSAKRLANGNTLIADTTNNRVIEVDPAKHIVFSTDEWGDGTGKLSDGTRLSYPNDAHELPDGTFMITDRNNDRCVHTDRAGKVLWAYGLDIHHPHNCDLLPNGNVIIANSDARNIIEVNRDKEIVWQYGDGSTDMLNWPRDADRLENGNTLVADSKNSRVLEINPQGRVVWTYQVPHFSNFYDVDRLDNGNILVSDQQHHQVLEVDRGGHLVWAFRNYREVRPINPRLKNGSFKTRLDDDTAEHWVLCTRLSEGGGRLIWDEKADPRPCPGLEYDRSGALYLMQRIHMKGGRRYQMSGKIRTENMSEGSLAYFQIAFMDAHGGYTADTADLPKGQLFTGDHDWTQDTFEAIAPPNATAAEIRAVITGKGRVFVNSIMVFN